jgi:hypothetical protein
MWFSGALYPIPVVVAFGKCRSNRSPRDAPDTTAPTTRSRNSKKLGFGRDSALQNPNQCRQIQRSTPPRESRFNPAKIRANTLGAVVVNDDVNVKNIRATITAVVKRFFLRINTNHVFQYTQS